MIFDVVVNVVTGEVQVLAGGEDVNIFHHNGRVIPTLGVVEPWGENEDSMGRADGMLAEMGWQRVTPWEGVEFSTCQVVFKPRD